MSALLNMVFICEVQSEFEGLYRAVCLEPRRDLIFLAEIARRAMPRGHQGVLRRHKLASVPRPRFENLLANGDVRAVDLIRPRAVRTSELRLTESQRRVLHARREAMYEFLDPVRLVAALTDIGGLGPLVRRAVERSGLSRASVYRLWDRLCEHGMELSSLHPQFDRCGAPGIRRSARADRRPIGRPTRAEALGLVALPTQRRVNERDRDIMRSYLSAQKLVGKTWYSVYGRMLQDHYQKAVTSESATVAPMLVAGDYPNFRQFQYFVRTELSREESIRLRTTSGHFNRNLRGLVGSSTDGIFGPGHAYAMDSTVADIYLRSSIDRSWIVGRPVLYILVDVWSSAVVGFYVCLNGPSWMTAKVALFECATSRELRDSIWGCNTGLGLDPSPSLPYELHVDRGEYLSQGARDTARNFGFTVVHTASRRPDLRGIVEVHHRLVKDVQIRYIPGAMDARRKELELRRSQPNASVMTLREYVHFLCALFRNHNLSRDRTARQTAEMVTAGVEPTPAGLWRFGHMVGRDFGKAVASESLVTGLLPDVSLSLRANGLWVGRLPYEFCNGRQSVESLSVVSRNFGASREIAHYSPGSVDRVFWPQTDGRIETLRLAPHTPVNRDSSVFEWADVLAAQQMQYAARNHRRACGEVALGREAGEIVASATRATRNAELRESNAPLLGMTDARSQELSLFHHVVASDAPTPNSAVDASGSADEDARHEAMLRELLSETGVLS